MLLNIHQLLTRLLKLGIDFTFVCEIYDLKSKFLICKGFPSLQTRSLRSNWDLGLLIQFYGVRKTGGPRRKTGGPGRKTGGPGERPS
jgi:hypothetical protein